MNLAKGILFFVLPLFYKCSTCFAQDHGINNLGDLPYSVCFSPNVSDNEKVNAEHNEYLLKKDPLWNKKRAVYDQQLSQFLRTKKVGGSVQSVITIPVVVHVVYNNSSQNISNSQILSQITALNEDFGRTNADTVNTPTPFIPIAANTGIQFCLAQRDPNGNPTSGIERRQTTVVNFTANDDMKYFSTGGLDIWDPMRYFNIWVCDISQVASGYGEFPTSTPSNTYGAVILYNCFGTVGNLTPGYDKGRTTTHEIGHCFNLRHIWGDDGNACSGSDSCADTPNQAGSSSGCPMNPLYDVCTSTGAGVMFENYMDYSSDACKNLFTQDQSARMNTVLSTAPYNTLSTSNGCQPVPLTNDDAGIIAVINPNGNLCTGSFVPIVTLKNCGLNTLDSCRINYQLDANTVMTYNWSGNLASLAAVNVTLSSMTASPGAHTFSAWTSFPNGNTDTQTFNDLSVTNFSVVVNGTALAVIEGFESSAFVPAGWTLNNIDSSLSWVRTTQAAQGGIASAKMSNGFYPGGMGQKDEMIMFPVDLTTVVNPILTFDVAYAYYIQTNPPAVYTDSLTVLVSTDCGQTYTLIYYKGGTQLATIQPTPNSSSEFIPGPSNWRFETVSLSSFQASTNAIIKFRNTSGYGDALYLDNINILNANGVKEDINELPPFSIYPNPSSGHFYLDLRQEGGDPYFIVMDVLGQEILSGKVSDTMEINLCDKPEGLYFIKVSWGGKFYSTKMLVSKPRH